MTGWNAPGPWKIVAVETHPIQYKAPFFRMLHLEPRLDLIVLYAMVPDSTKQGDGFGVAFKWDVPVLNGYNYELLENRSKNPSVSCFRGCDTPAILQRLKELRPDALLVNGWVVKTCLQALFACRRLGIPCIIRGEANDLRPRVWWKTVLHKLLLRQYSAFISIGKSNREFYVNRGVAPEKIFNGFYCVESERFAKQCEDAKLEWKGLRKKWGIPLDSVCFVFSGKFEEKKRPMDMLYALHKVTESSTLKPQKGKSKNVCKLHLLMVGDGKLRIECETYAEQHNLPVTFTGFLNQSEMPQAYAVSDCMVLASDFGETWGLVVNEAFACSLPAIVSDHVGCHPDLIMPGKTGEVFPFGNIDRLAQVMQEFSRDKEVLIEMGQNACNHIHAYSIDNLVQGTLEAVRFVANR